MVPFHKIRHLSSVPLDLNVCCQNVHTTRCKSNIAYISESVEIIQNMMKMSYIKEVLCSINGSKFQRHGFMFPQTGLIVFNFLKNRKCDSV